MTRRKARRVRIERNLMRRERGSTPRRTAIVRRRFDRAWRRALRHAVNVDEAVFKLMIGAVQAEAEA